MKLTLIFRVAYKHEKKIEKLFKTRVMKLETNHNFSI